MEPDTGNLILEAKYASDHDNRVYTFQQFKECYPDDFEIKWVTGTKWRKGDECEVYYMKSWERGTISEFTPRKKQLSTFVTVHCFNLDCKVKGEMLRPRTFTMIGEKKEKHTAKHISGRRKSRRKKEPRLQEGTKETALDEDKDNLKHLMYIHPAAPVSEDMQASSTDDEEQFVMDVVKNIIHRKSTADAKFYLKYMDFLRRVSSATPEWKKRAYGKYLEKQEEHEKEKHKQVLQVIKEGVCEIWNAFDYDKKSEIDLSANEGIQKLVWEMFVAWQKTEIKLHLQTSRNIVDELALPSHMRDQFELLYWGRVTKDLKTVADKHFEPLRLELKEPVRFLSTIKQIRKEDFIRRVMDSVKKCIEETSHMERMQAAENKIATALARLAFSDMKASYTLATKSGHSAVKSVSGGELLTDSFQQHA
eukprot:CAMPEP_0170176860 /NCGR_PEP_ID=MMETSP0040_2-20121228/9634_1 /TAXON_ID=641309 /ORGANISM="Lotharella oceanica, Strain CCMP622" /LENGTH=420 /DNA_ID=CAMNT_0010419309 /DNA_START=108 /DNA_END=1370 /DNA_ORIENTATION=+